MKRFSKIVSRIMDVPSAHGHQRHQLGLAVRGEAGEGLGIDIHRLKRMAVAVDADAFVGGLDADPGPAHHIDHGAEVPGIGILQQHVAAGHAHAHGIGAGLDAVRDHAVLRARQAGHAPDPEGGAVDALDLRAHLDEAGGDVADLGLGGGILDHRVAIGHHGGHQGRMGGADRDLVEGDVGALEALPRPGDHVAALDGDLGAELFHGHEVHVHGPRSDGAAAGQRHLRLTAARQQRAQHPEARPHLGDEVVRGGGVRDVAGGEMHHVAHHAVLAGALARHHDVDAVVLQDALQEPHIGQARHVGECQRFRRQQRNDHQRQGGILGARNGNGPVQAVSAADADAIHVF
jgi:hypothetical protein